MLGSVCVCVCVCTCVCVCVCVCVCTCVCVCVCALKKPPKNNNKKQNKRKSLVRHIQTVNLRYRHTEVTNGGTFPSAKLFIMAQLNASVCVLYHAT